VLIYGLGLIAEAVPLYLSYFKPKADAIHFTREIKESGHLDIIFLVASREGAAHAQLKEPQHGNCGAIQKGRNVVPVRMSFCVQNHLQYCQLYKDNYLQSLLK
jgi:hypothetical protein